MGRLTSIFAPPTTTVPVPGPRPHAAITDAVGSIRPAEQRRLDLWADRSPSVKIAMEGDRISGSRNVAPAPRGGQTT